MPNASKLRCPAPPAPISSCERVTVVVMSYAGGRLDTLVVTLRHYANAPVVQEVVLVWNKGKAPRRVRTLALRLAPRLRIVEFTTNRLMNRFHPSIRPASTAVMLADDDLLVPPATIAGGLQVWCRNQAALAGLAARHFEGDATSPGGYRYGRGHCDPTPHAPTLWQRVRQLVSSSYAKLLFKLLYSTYLVLLLHINLLRREPRDCSKVFVLDFAGETAGARALSAKVFGTELLWGSA